MITIQGFAKLCGCNTQTLRYYDRIGLLTPAKVDPWTGYRYYEEEQAVQFVKIKNLQQADFSIEEIKNLLGKNDVLLMEAFEEKIREQELKLEKIKQIQQSYLEEAMDMQKMVNTVLGFVENKVSNPELWKEFGLEQEKENEIIAKVHEVLADWLGQCKEDGVDVSAMADDKAIDGLMNVVKEMEEGTFDEAQNMILAREGTNPEKDIPADAKKVMTRDGWEHIYEWIQELPDLGDGKENFFLFRIRKDSAANNPGFATMMLAVMAARYDAMKGGMTCKTCLSDDGVNHFALYRR